MHKLVQKIPEHTNEKYFFGPEICETIVEQQLSGHSWYLRGLCEYYEQFGGVQVREILQSTVENLYYPTIGRYCTYPIDRSQDKEGGVSGHSGDEQNGWLLSTDIGCAFMSIDGLSHYYKLSGDAKTKALLDEMIEVFCAIDKKKLKAQTHCSLTAARGMVRMYAQTGEENYLKCAKDIFSLYIDSGMTYTYHNFNWWGKGDTWTEPCAIVDSAMLAGELFQITGETCYKTLLARIFHNAFATLQRDNGGAGCESTVSRTTHTLSMKLYEAYFCCTMRLAEGLWYLSENQTLLTPNITGKVKKDRIGRYMDGDILYTELVPAMLPYAQMDAMRSADGKTLVPLIKMYHVPKDLAEKLEQRIIF
jgi:hypothetical protein